MGSGAGSADTMNSSKNWLQVEIDEDEIRRAPIFTFSNCMTLCDVKCDNYTRLLVADIQIADADKYSAQLKVFRGTVLMSEHNLGGIPSAIESFYIEEKEPKVPIVAVAISETILFYRNLKPYFKYTIPETEADDMEKELWRKMTIVRLDQQEALIKDLKNIDCARLTRKSQRLLQLNGERERDEFIREHAESPLTRQASIVAMCCIRRLSGDANPPSHLLVATDNGDIFILEAQGFSLLHRAKTCGYQTTPSLLAVHGDFETDFRIVVATRNGAVYLLRKSEVEGQEIFKIPQPLTGILLLPIDQTIIVSSIDKRLLCYSKKGKQLYCVALAAVPVCLLPITLTHLGMTVVCVALAGGLVQFYMQRHLADQFQMEDTVGAIIFGRMGLEEHVLSMITVNGKLFVKILKRSAEFHPINMTANLKLNQLHQGISNSILDKPKKSSIFVEQAAREKQNAKAAYGAFQVELWRLRHTVARAIRHAMHSSESTISGDITHAPVKLSAEVGGVGPVFRLYLIVHNLSTYKMASNLTILLHADRRHYTIANSSAKLPSILPGLPLKIDFEVSAVLDEHDKLPPHTLTPDNAHIRIIVVKAHQANPLIAAFIDMPQSEAGI